MATAFPFAAVIFDMDGVIVDSEAFYQEVLARFVREHGLDVSDDELRGLIGCAQQHFDKTLVAWYEALGAGTLSVAEAKRRYRLWRDRIPCDYRSLLFPGVREAVQGLADRGVRLALASSSPRSNIREVLGACCLSRAFEVVVSGAELVASKPDPAIYRHALHLLGLPAEACCCIEDSVPGITAGRRAGLTVVARREERFGFSQEEADIIVDRVDELLDEGFAQRLARSRSARGEGARSEPCVR